MAHEKKQRENGKNGQSLYPPGRHERPSAPMPEGPPQNRYSKRTASKRMLTGEDAGWHEFSGAGAYAARPGQPDE